MLRHTPRASFIALGVILAGTAHAATEPVRIVVDGEHLSYSFGQGGWVRLKGAVKLHVEGADVIGETLEVYCDEAEVDALHGSLRVPGEVRVISGMGLAVGEGLTLDTQTTEFSLDKLCACLSDPETVPRRFVYVKGGKVGRQRDVLVVMRGQVTTCDRDHPHWSLGARELTLDPRTGDLQMSRLSLRFLGVRVPLLPWAKADLSPKKKRWGVDLSTTPGYSGREGLFVPYSWRMTPLDAPLNATVAFHVTTQQGVTGKAFMSRSWGDTDLDLRASRKEWMPDDITDQLELYRLPEFSVTRYVGGREGSRELRVGLQAGRYRETLVGIGDDGNHSERLGEGVRADRLATTAVYTVGAPALREHVGRWYGFSGKWAEYDTGQDYGDLELFAGRGGRLSDSLSGYGTLRHHLVTGSTPFLFDEVDMRSELTLGADWQLDRLWRVRGTGRFDLDETEFRDYEVRINRQVHCLTWGAYYRGIGSQFGLTLDLTGFTGDTRPYPAKSSLQKRLEAEGLQVFPDGYPTSGKPVGGSTEESRPAAPSRGAPADPTRPDGKPADGVSDAPDGGNPAPDAAGKSTGAAPPGASTEEW